MKAISSMHRRSFKGFTLIELLVVLSIIGVMFAMLLPSITMARENARRAKCGSNFRNILLFTNTYSADNRQILPSISFDGYGVIGVINNGFNPGAGSAAAVRSGVINNATSKLLANYLNFSWDQNQNWTSAMSTQVLKLPDVLHCPSLESDRNYYTNDYRYKKIGQFDFDGASGNTLMGFATWLGMNSFSPGQAWARGCNIRVDKLRFPSDESYLYDRFFHPSAPGGGTLNGANLNFSAAHNDAGGRAEGLNQGFADGSVRWFNKKQLNYYYTPSQYNWDRAQTLAYFADVNRAVLNRGGYPTVNFGPSVATANETTRVFFGLTKGGWGGSSAGGVFTP